MYHHFYLSNCTAVLAQQNCLAVLCLCAHCCCVCVHCVIKVVMEYVCRGFEHWSPFTLHSSSNFCDFC